MKTISGIPFAGDGHAEGRRPGDAASLGVSAFDPLIAAMREPSSTGLAICGTLMLAISVRREFFKH